MLPSPAPQTLRRSSGKPERRGEATTDSSGVVPRDHDGFRRFVLAAVAEADEETRAVLAQLQFEVLSLQGAPFSGLE